MRYRDLDRQFVIADWRLQTEDSLIDDWRLAIGTNPIDDPRIDNPSIFNLQSSVFNRLLLADLNQRIHLDRRADGLFLPGRPDHVDAVDRFGGAEAEVQRIQAVRQVP